MLATILGLFFICNGIFLVLRPQILVRWLQKKTGRLFRKFLFSLSLILGAMLISLGWKYEGLLPKIIVIIGIMSLIKGLFVFNAKAADKLIEWSIKLPLIYYRLGACIHIAIGIMILRLR